MAAFKITTFLVLGLAAVLRMHPALAQEGTHAHVEDLSPACLTRLNDLYALYTNVDGGSTENPCISTIQQALVLRGSEGCPETVDIQSCFAEHAAEWTAFDEACELLHYHDEEDHEHEGEEAHAPGEEHDHGDDHEVEVGCLPAFETRADFAAYTFADADQSAPHVHGSSAAIVGLVAMLTAAVAVHM